MVQISSINMIWIKSLIAWQSQKLHVPMYINNARIVNQVIPINFQDNCDKVQSGLLSSSPS